MSLPTLQFGCYRTGMKTKPAKAAGRARLTRTVSLFPKHEALLAEEAQARVAEHGRVHGLYSVIVQDLIEEGLGGKKSGRFKVADSTFRADCRDILAGSGWDVAEGKTVSGYVVDFYVTRGKKHCAVLLADRVREERLQNSLASAMLLKVEASVPVVVCTPYILDATVQRAFAAAGMKLCSPPELEQSVAASAH